MVVGLAALGLCVTVGLAFSGVTQAGLSAPGGAAIFLGGLTGLVGTYLALLMVLLVSRIPPVERAFGQDGLLRWHRRLGPWPISLLILHAVIITIGYAEAARTGSWHQLGVFISSYPDMLAATVGLGLMLMAGFVSIRAIRQRLRRETWWTIHLYMYLALALSFAHVIVLGPAFVGHPLTRAVWVVVWVATAGTVLVYRVGLPLARTLHHGLRVVEVRPEAPGVVSIICRGRRLDRLAVSGGQFFLWRFLTKDLWWQAHPYSLSALPRPPHLRLTVKGVGDHSGALARLRPGTRVAIEGPYGTFTPHERRQEKVLLIAGGIGITAVRALLEDLPMGSDPVVVIRASRNEELVFRSEIVKLVGQRNGTLHELVGSRRSTVLDERLLRELVPGLGRRDVYVCGPEGFVAGMVEVLGRSGVPEDAIHHEAFSL
ncbi:MAG TPA: ferredoxin reductase family protein [Acidimicrobiales bacterium]|nr:ferredoxin reductase family protein [Acidimicrobiales bacterium]